MTQLEVVQGLTVSKHNQTTRRENTLSTWKHHKLSKTYQDLHDLHLRKSGN